MSEDWDDLVSPFDEPKSARVKDKPTDYTIRLCKYGHEKRGDNLAIVHKKDGTKEYRCVKCHRRRQNAFHARQRARKAQEVGLRSSA